jgi:hypothetical protein
MKKVINTLLALCLLTACNRAAKDTVDYAKDEDNGLRKEINVGNMHYSIQYKPAAYILEQEHADPETVARRAAQLKGMVWFNITFSVKGYGQSPLRYQASGLDEYASRQDYFLNNAAQDLRLQYGTDTLQIASYWFENNQNLTPHETMVVGFQLPAGDSIPVQDLKLSYYDRIFHNGIIKARIRKEDLQ